MREELWVEGLRIVEVDHAPGLCLGRHAHDVVKVCIVLEGGATERCGVDVVTPGPLEAVLRPANRTHENQYHAAGARSLLVEIDPCDRAARGASEGVAIDRAQAVVLTSRLVAAFRARRSSRARLALGAARALVGAFDTARRPGTPAWLDAARERLAAEFACPPPLADLARALKVHPTYLAQAFHARWGTTTRAFVRAHRVFHAMDLVQRGAPLATAASAAGFADQSHMTRAFREARGEAPGRIRARRP